MGSWPKERKSVSGFSRVSHLKAGTGSWGAPGAVGCTGCSKAAPPPHQLLSFLFREWPGLHLWVSLHCAMPWGWSKKDLQFGTPTLSFVAKRHPPLKISMPRVSDHPSSPLPHLLFPPTSRPFRPQSAGICSQAGRWCHLKRFPLSSKGTKRGRNTVPQACSSSHSLQSN